MFAFEFLIIPVHVEHLDKVFGASVQNYVDKRKGKVSCISH